jgi:hypothetical protein
MSKRLHLIKKPADLPVFFFGHGAMLKRTRGAAFFFFPYRYSYSLPTGHGKRIAALNEKADSGLLHSCPETAFFI